MDGSWPPRPDARCFLLLFSGLAILVLLSSVGTGVEPFAATGARAIPLPSMLALSPLDFPKLPAFARAIAALNASASTAACPTAWRTAHALAQRSGTAAHLEPRWWESGAPPVPR